MQASSATGCAAINAGVEREGAFYLFTLRLVPAFPFFVINLLMGLTPIRTWTFYWVSQLGMLLGTVVYVNAGTQLAQIESLRASCRRAAALVCAARPVPAGREEDRGLAQGAQGLREVAEAARASTATWS